MDGMDAVDEVDGGSHVIATIHRSLALFVWGGVKKVIKRSSDQAGFEREGKGDDS